MNMNPGTVVTPQGDPEYNVEVIIGVTTSPVDENGMVDVVWISDSRGVFKCWEQVTDLNVADLRDRQRISDPLIYHDRVGKALGKLPVYAGQRQDPAR